MCGLASPLGWPANHRLQKVCVCWRSRETRKRPRGDQYTCEGVAVGDASTFLKMSKLICLRRAARPPPALSAMLANNFSTIHPRVLRFLSWLSSRALAQHSVTRTNNFSTRARPAPAASTTCTSSAASSTRTRPAPARKAVLVPAPAPQMRVPATGEG